MEAAACPEHYEWPVAKERGGGSANLRVSTPTEKRALVITDPIAVSEHLVGLERVNVLGVDDPAAGPLRVHGSRDGFSKLGVTQSEQSLLEWDGGVVPRETSSPGWPGSSSPR